MTPRTDLEKAKSRLLARRGRLETVQGEIRAGEAAVGGGELREPDLLDQGSDETEARRLDLLAESEREELLRIDAALERIRQGTWGRCLSCEGPIEARRLQAMPEAVLCRECQAAVSERIAAGNARWGGAG